MRRENFKFQTLVWKVAEECRNLSATATQRSRQSWFTKPLSRRWPSLQASLSIPLLTP